MPSREALTRYASEMWDELVFLRDILLRGHPSDWEHSCAAGIEELLYDIETYTGKAGSSSLTDADLDAFYRDWQQRNNNNSNGATS